MASSLDIQNIVLVFLKLTKLLTDKKWLKFDKLVPTYNEKNRSSWRTSTRPSRKSLKMGERIR